MEGEAMIMLTSILINDKLMAQDAPLEWHLQF